MLAMEQIAALIAAASLGVIGTNLFVHRMPDGLTSGTLVLPRLAGVPINYETRGYFKGGFQIISRDPSPNTADQNARAISAVVYRDQGWITLPSYLTIPAASVFLIRAEHLPIVFPKSDEGDVYEASVNYEFVCA